MCDGFIKHKNFFENNFVLTIIFSLQFTETGIFKWFVCILACSYVFLINIPYLNSIVVSFEITLLEHERDL